MSIATKVLTIVGDVLVADLPDEWNGTFAIQYPTAGTGTYVAEIMIGTDWVIARVINQSDNLGALSITVPGIYYLEYLTYLKARVRKTVGTVATSISIALGNG